MIDVSVDHDFSLVAQTLKTASVPEYVLSAPLNELGVDQVIPDSAYAWHKGDNKFFPCHTKAASFMSRLYFDTQRPGMDSKQAEMIDANLTRLAAVHGIDPADFDEALQTIKQAQSPQDTPDSLAKALNLLTLRDKEAFKPGQLISAARELKQAGADSRLIDQWAFDQPLQNLNALQALAVTLKSPKLAAFAEELGTMPPREWSSKLPEIADAIYEKTKSTDATRRKLAAIPTCETADVRLCGQNYSVGSLKPLLPKIATFVDGQVYGALRGLPVSDWAERLEKLPANKQRRIVDLIA